MVSAYLFEKVPRPEGIYYTWSKTRLIENVFTLTLALTLTLKRNNVFGLTKWRHFSIKCIDTSFRVSRVTIFGGFGPGPTLQS